MILAGLGVGSGEYIIWPFMTATVGLGFLWAAVLSVTVQYFLNMEIERYTLATGETAVSGFVRFWKPWGMLFCLFTILPNMWPGWATSGVTILTFLIGGGNVPLITIGMLVASGIALTTSPVVYQTLERAQFFKVGLTLVFLAVAIVAAISPSAWADLPQAVTQLRPAPRLERDSDLSDPERAGLRRGGRREQPRAEQLDPRQGLRDGRLHPAHRVADHRRRGGGAGDGVDGASGRGEPAALPRLVGVANKEQLVSFWFICVFSITVFSTLAYSTVFGQNISSGQANLAFIKAEGEALKTIVAPVVRHVLLGLRLAVDDPGRARHHRLHLAHRRRRAQDRVSAAEPAMDGKPDLFSRGLGHDRGRVDILLSGFNQPLLLLVIAACLNGMVMFVYSILLIQLNRRGLPPALRVGGVRLGMLVFATVFYGFFAGWLVLVQVRGYLAGAEGGRQPSFPRRSPSSLNTQGIRCDGSTSMTRSKR